MQGGRPGGGCACRLTASRKQRAEGRGYRKPSRALTCALMPAWVHRPIISRCEHRAGNQAGGPHKPAWPSAAGRVLDCKALVWAQGDEKRADIPPHGLALHLPCPPADLLAD